MDEKQRIVWLDQLKAISMYLVVLGHSIIKFKEEFIFKFIYSFHMPLFFMISGMVFRPEKYQSMMDCIKDKVIRLLYPYIMLNILILPLWYINMKTGMIPHDSIFKILLGIVYSNSAVLRAPSNATWFLMTLFFAEILYYALHRYLKDDKLVFIMSSVLLVIGMISNKGQAFYASPYHLDTAFVAQFYYGCGYMLRKNFNYFKVCFQKYTLCKVGLLAGAGILFSVINKQLDLSNQLYRNYVMGLMSTFSLSLLLIFIVQKLNIKSKLLTFIGQNTIIILAFHIPVLRIYQAIFPVLMSRQSFCILASVIVFITMLPTVWIVKKLFGFMVKMPNKLQEFVCGL